VYGGALRAFLRHEVNLAAASASPAVRPAATVSRVMADEREAGLAADDAYLAFADDVRRVRHAALRYLRSRRAAGVRVLAYGAPARATTLLNWYHVGPELIGFTADISLAKQGRFIPGCALPILAPADLVRSRPDEILILTWDIAAEVVGQLVDLGIDERRTRFLVPIPRLMEISLSGAP
jgi:hypothetical protein